MRKYSEFNTQGSIKMNMLLSFLLKIHKYIIILKIERNAFKI